MEQYSFLSEKNKHIDSNHRFDLYFVDTTFRDRTATMVYRLYPAVCNSIFVFLGDYGYCLLSENIAIISQPANQPTN